MPCLAAVAFVPAFYAEITAGIHHGLVPVVEAHKIRRSTALSPDLNDHPVPVR